MTQIYLMVNTTAADRTHAAASAAPAASFSRASGKVPVRSVATNAIALLNFRMVGKPETMRLLSKHPHYKH